MRFNIGKNSKKYMVKYYEWKTRLRAISAFLTWIEAIEIFLCYLCNPQK